MATPCPLVLPSSSNSSTIRPREWRSPDPRLRAMELNLLQIGGDTWNRCGRGWLNVDGAYDAGDAPGLVANVPVAD